MKTYDVWKYYLAKMNWFVHSDPHCLSDHFSKLRCQKDEKREGESNIKREREREREREKGQSM